MVSLRQVLQLLLLDAIILSTVAAIRQTGLQAGMVCLFDYRFVMVPQLKSFMKVCIGFDLWAGFLNVLTFLLATALMLMG
jgi:hypothetical protein